MGVPRVQRGHHSRRTPQGAQRQHLSAPREPHATTGCTSVRRAVQVLVANRDEGGPRGRASGRVHQPRADVVDLGDHVGAILEVLRVTAVHMCGRCECEEPRMRGSASVGRCSSKCNSCAVQRGLRRRHSCCAMWTHRARVCVASTGTPARRQRRASTQEVGRTSRGNEITTMVVKS